MGLLLTVIVAALSAPLHLLHPLHPSLSPLVTVLSPSAQGVLPLHPLSLSGTADGDCGPVLPFVLGPQRGPWLLDSTQLDSPYLIQNASAFLFIKERAVECTYHEYIEMY